MKDGFEGEGTPGSPWRDDLDRLGRIMSGVSLHFGRRLRSIAFQRSVPEAPLDVIQVDLDRVTASDVKVLDRLALGECLISVLSKFAVRVRILPTPTVPLGENPAGKPAKGPHDLGPASRKRRQEAVETIERGILKGFEAHDNIFGRKVTIVDREGDAYLMKSTGETAADRLLIWRYRLKKAEIVQLFDKGWLC